MRTIKFRAWSKKAESMFYAGEDNLLQFKDGKWIMACPVYEIDWCKEENGDVLMQYTGLKDKNGKEIYEGDIVRVLKYLSTYNQPKPVFEIVFKDGVFTYKNTKFDNDGIVTEPGVNEVIGNIYENKDLLN
jgi:uncharacterized phage protein (TIGR01671 family)